MSHNFEDGNFEMGERQRKYPHITIALQLIFGASLIAWTYWFLHHIPGVR